ncbi:hypothetical protein EG68_00112 [Paragonimus skrjabini miyazakii]|uniref:Uncharacterized protein n=1 Tax=Paragonimus skrjabini miyazakii TaxID=59628 RepID=A0A8S9Z565_9TREM|nr:hypothetical protein EG68_00112 [Paragonimus skrjabini miyazakii]
MLSLLHLQTVLYGQNLLNKIPINSFTEFSGFIETPVEFIQKESNSTLIRKLTAQISTHLFHLEQPAECISTGESIGCHGFNLDYLLNSLANFSQDECQERVPQLAMLFTTRENVTEVMNKVINSDQKGCRLYWIIVDQSDVEVDRLIQLLNTIDHRKTNMAVIRQIPLSYPLKLPRIAVDSHKDIDVDLVSMNATEYPERIFIAVSVIFQISQAYIDALQIYPERFITQPLICTTTSPKIFIAGEKIRQDTQHESPFVNEAVVTSDGKLSNPSGMIVDVVKLLAERFHFKPIYLHSRDGKFGDVDKDGNWTGLIRDLLDDYIDIAAGPISFNEPRSKVIHQLGPFMYLSTALAGAKSSGDNSMFKMLRPFQYSTWIIVTLTVLLGGSLLFVLNRYSPFCAYNLQLPGANPDEVSFPQNLWSAVSRFLLQGYDIYPLAFSGRALLVLFCFTTVTLHATWQADMTAFMTRKWIPPPITSLSELAYSQTYQPFAISGSSIITDFATAKENPVMQEIYHKMLSNQRLVQTTADAISLLLDDPTMIFLHDKHVLQYSFNRNCNAIQILPVHFGQTPSGFAVAPGREFEQPFTDYLIHLYEIGSIDRLFRKWWFASEVCSTSEPYYQPMALKDLMGAFIILTVALIVSLLVLAAEFGHFHCLRQVALNRKHRRVADNTANCDEPTERRRSAMMLNVLPEATANSLRYAGRKRASRAYNASVIDLQFASQ